MSQMKKLTINGSEFEIVDEQARFSIDSVVAEKAPLASPALTGTPTAPTAVTGTNNAQIATTAFVQSAISNMGGGTEIVVSGTQPSGQSHGSMWFKII